MPATTESRGFLALPGGRVEYVDHPATGPATPTLVLLHEGLGCVALWKTFPAELAAATGCRVLAYSRFGYGASDPVTLPRPLTYMHEEGIDVLPAVLDAAGVGECILVGHSDGASIAICFGGGRADGRLRGLVLMAPHVFNEPLSVASIEAARDAYGAGLREKLARYHGDNVDCAFRGWNDAWLDPGFRHWNIEPFCTAIGVPTLVIQGHDDEYGTLAQVDAIVAGIPGPVDTLLLDQCGHSPQRDQPRATIDAIAGFVEGLAGH